MPASMRSRGVELPSTSLEEEVNETFQPLKQLLVVNEDPLEDYRGKPWYGKLFVFLFYVFPILEWASNYKVEWLLGDIIGGLTITSLAVPQVSPSHAEDSVANSAAARRDARRRRMLPSGPAQGLQALRQRRRMRTGRRH